LVVDADELQPASTTELIGELPQGKGETFWLREGQIVETLAGYREGDAAFSDTAWLRGPIKPDLPVRICYHLAVC
jgi:hypothetical protein